MAHRRAPEVDAELDEIWYYLARESGSVEIADRQIDRLTEAFYFLSTHPHVGRRRDEDLRPGLRSFPVGAHVIVYRVEASSVVILHVFPWQPRYSGTVGSAVCKVIRDVNKNYVRAHCA